MQMRDKVKRRDHIPHRRMNRGIVREQCFQDTIDNIRSPRYRLRREPTLDRALKNGLHTAVARGLRPITHPRPPFFWERSRSVD